MYCSQNRKKEELVWTRGWQSNQIWSVATVINVNKIKRILIYIYIINSLNKENFCCLKSRNMKKKLKKLRAWEFRGPIQKSVCQMSLLPSSRLCPILPILKRPRMSF